MNRKLTILHVESHDQWAGQERRVVEECRWMAARGHRVHLAAAAGTPVFERARDAGVAVHPIRFRPAALVGNVLRMRRLIRELRPDVLNPHGNRDAKAALPAALGLGVPCVVRSRHMSVPVRNAVHNRLLYRRLCHRVFTTSRAAAEQVVRELGVPSERVHFVPSGIAPPAILPDRAEVRREIAARWKLPETDCWIGFVGRLSPEKGIPLLVTAFASLRREIPGARLVLVGGGGELDRLREQAEREGVADRVLLTGFQENPWRWHRALDLNVLPSLSGEGVPQSVLEAMYAGCPVIGSRDGGIPDVVRDGETGLLFTVGDADAVAEAIRTALDNAPATDRRAEAARRMIADGHTVDAMGRRILEIYDEALSARG